MPSENPARSPRSRALQLSDAQVTVLSMVAVGLVAAAVYARALGFGFFNDDPTGHFRWMEGLSFLQLFTSSAGYGFYRPLTFAAWKLLHALFGGYYGPGFHALGLVLHGANAALLWLVALRLSRRPIYAWVVALAFACFPLSYEAVAYVAAAFHPLLAFWALLTLLLYQRARQAHATGYLVAAYVTAVLGLLTHENGVIIPLLLLSWEWVTQPKPDLRELARRPARWFLVAPALFALLWLSIPKASGNSLRPLADVLRSALPFLQTMAFPLLPMVRVGASQVGLLALLAVATVALMYGLAYVARRRRVMVFALLWLLFSSLPSVMLLTPSYLYGSPRLYYLASLGAALLWGVPVLALESLLSRSPARRWGVRLAQVLVAVGIVVPALSFIRCQLDFFGLATEIVRRMAGQASETAPGQELVFVNVPFYFSSCSRYPTGCANPYPYAPTGAVIIPPYADARDFVRVNGGPDRPTRALTFTGYNPGWNTHGDPVDIEGLRESVQSGEVYVFDLVSWSWFDLTSAWQIDSTSTSSPRATFGELVSLEDLQVDGQGDSLVVTLTWQALQAPSRPLTVFVHLYDASGAVAAQHDGPPAQGFVPTPFWHSGDRVIDTHIVTPSAPLAAGSYQLAVGIYDPNTGERLPARAPDGSAIPDDAYPAGEVSWP